jgi:2'-5' RNA ligase
MTDSASDGRPWRCFWAVPLPDGLRSSLADAVTLLRADPTAEAEWRWTEPAGWHLTLAFLGAVPADRVPAVLAWVTDAVRGVDPFSADTGGLGSFPAGRRARVLWYGVSDPERRLRTLAGLVAEGSGIEAGAFRAHVTLARARDRQGALPPSRPVDGLPNGSVEVGAVTLFRSHLGRGPARYEALGVAPLAPAMAAAAR